MIALKENPVGIDLKIQGIQKYLYSNLSDFNIEAFGRCEVLDKKPIVFYKKNDYKEVLFINEKTNGKLFFVDSENTKVKRGLSTTEIDIIFLLNVSRIKPDIKHRADEELRVEISNILQRKFNKKEIDITKGDDALKDFETKLINTQPYYFLKFSLKIDYDTINC